MQFTGAACLTSPFLSAQFQINHNFTLSYVGLCIVQMSVLTAYSYIGILHLLTSPSSESTDRFLESIHSRLPL